MSHRFIELELLVFLKKLVKNCILGSANLTRPFFKNFGGGKTFNHLSFEDVRGVCLVNTELIISILGIVLLSTTK